MATRRNDETRIDLRLPQAGDKQELLDRLADEFVERLRGGERPSIQEYQQRYPQLAADIEEVLCSVAMIEDLKKQSESLGSAPANRFDEINLERIGDYRILRELGRGGMGIVFEAVHESLGRKVAIKVLPSRVFEGTTALDRFRREAQAAAKLHHSNIVNVFGVGEWEGYHYYVMELVNGRTVADLIRNWAGKSKPLAAPPLPGKTETDSAKLSPPPREIRFESPRDRFQWSAEKISRIADALEYSHRQGIMHRDIKPANILIDDAEQPWVTDFGLVKELTNQTMTKTGDIFGTPQYLAPEALEGNYDARSEVYCLGLTLYEMLALEPAFFDPSPTRLFRMIASATPKPLRLRDSAIPRDLETIVHKAIDRDPNARYQSAADFRDDLQRYCHDLPIKARRILPVERLWRWTRRNPLTAGLTALSISLLFVVAIVSSYAYFSTQDALDQLAAKHQDLERQQKQTEAARKLAEKNEEKMRREFERAEANVDLSMQAFDELFKRIMSKGVGRDLKENMELETFSELSSIESAITRDDARILQGAIQFYEKFTRQNQDNDKLKIEIAKAYRRIANIYHFLGDLMAARRGYAKAIEAYQQVVEQRPDDLSVVVSLAECRNELGLAYRKQGMLAAGMKEHEQARKLLQQEKYESHPDCQFTLCNTLINLCSFSSGGVDASVRGFRPPRFLDRDRNIRKSLGDFIRLVPRRAAFLDQADKISLALLKQDPANPDYRLLRAKLYRTRATIFGVDGDLQVEIEKLQQSIKELESLIKDFPDDPKYRFTLAHTYTIRLRNVGRDVQIQMNEKARDICQQLVQDFPSALEYQDLLASILLRLGHYYLLEKKLPEAVRTLELAKETLVGMIRRSPSMMAYYMQFIAASDLLADAHIEAGDRDQAIKEIQSLLWYLQTARPLNRNRQRKVDLMDKARAKLKGLRESSRSRQ